MIKGIRLIVYPVTDLKAAKTQYSALLGVEPYAENDYYVGFKTGDLEIGLDPNGHQLRATGPICFWHVDDVKTALQSSLASGAQLLQDIKDFGNGKMWATVKEADGNIIGLIQVP
ncbi:MAG: glyoxalase [Anaerolineae bacterium]